VLETPEGQKWLMTPRAQRFFDTKTGDDYLRTPEGQRWIGTQEVQKWLMTPEGQGFFETRAGQWSFQGEIWLGTPEVKEWLKTPLGRRFTIRQEELRRERVERIQELARKSEEEARRREEWEKASAYADSPKERSKREAKQREMAVRQYIQNQESRYPSREGC
jgi:hypothetical protein